MFESYWSVMDGLFIGDRDAAEDPKFFLENKVTRVINCSASSIDNHWDSMGIVYLNYNWRDVDTETILDDYDVVANQVFDFIEEAEERGEGVLVQSFHGRSRSSCVLTAYLMKKYCWSLQTALEFLSFKCPVLNPNDGFLDQLEAYEERLISHRDSDGDDADASSSGAVMLQNTYANCQRTPFSDVQLCKTVSARRTHAVTFSDNIVNVKAYDVGSLLEGSPHADPLDVENHKPVAVGQPGLKSAMKSAPRRSAMKSPRDLGSGAIVIQRRSGMVRCHPQDIVPKRFGVQIQSRTILLEYSVPKYGLRAHHAIPVDLDNPRVLDCKSSSGDDLMRNTAIARRLHCEHEHWLSDVSIEQLAELVGRLRSSPKKKVKKPIENTVEKSE